MSSVASLDKVVALAKRRGFVYPTSEIYGGLTSSYDYGPLGTELLRTIRNTWWDMFVKKRDDMVGLDSQILLHPKTWVASGHVSSFNDPLVEDKVTHKRYRADHLIESWLEKNPIANPVNVESMDIEAINDFIQEHAILSPDGNPITNAKPFNILFESSIGTVTGDKSKVYLRGETAQGIFSNFQNVINSSRVQLPFGIGQIGKSFRNEITSGQFVFRTLEFEQAEIEYFFDPETNQWEPLFESWREAMWQYVVGVLGISQENLRWRRHEDQERSFYSQETYDLEYKYPFGFKELWGIAYRTDYDLKQHIKHSGQKLEYTDPFTGKKLVPHVIEPAVGVNRLFLMILCDALYEDADNNRIVLKLKPSIAPYTAAVFPLLKNKPDLVEYARKVFTDLQTHMPVMWDDRGNIGKRYYAQDEIGTPFCITVDFDTLKDGSVTVRDRDSARQERVASDKVVEYINQKIYASN
jgi:glycyl-tRNA synthetase